MNKHRTFSRMLEKLPDSTPFSFNYQPSRIDRNALFALNRTFNRDAISSARTEYHRAHLTFEDLKDDLLKYDCVHTPRGVSPSYAMAYASVVNDLKLPQGTLVPMTHGAVVAYPSFPTSKSPGIPLKQEGFKTKGEAVADPQVMHDIRREWYAIERGVKIQLPDCAAYARAQLCPRDKNKIRATWGVPLTVICTEGQYAYPFLEHLKGLENPIIAYGLEIANGGMKYIDTMVNNFPGLPILMGDWKEFDKHVPAWLIRDAFKIASTAFDFTKVIDAEGKLWPVRPNRSNRRWRKMVSYFIDTPIRLSNGERYMKHGGVPSGSLWTNIIDSIVNALVMRYLTYELTGSLPLADVYLGDDSIVVLTKPIDIEQFAEVALSEFGFIFNTNKSYQTTNPRNVFFLGYFNDCGHPDKPIDTIIASSVYPERPVRNKIDTIARLCGQAYSTFEPVHAQNFFKAANILANEEGLKMEDLEEWIHQHPENFKFLNTLGIDPTTITIPTIEEDIPTLVTQPNAPRREFRVPVRDLDALYTEGCRLVYYTNEVDDDSDSSVT